MKQYSVSRKKSPRERLCPLDDVRHRLRQQRVEHPEERDAERDRGGGRFAEPAREGRKFQRAARDAEKRQRGQEVNRQVEQMKSADVPSAERVIEREGQVRDRPRPGQDAPDQVLPRAEQAEEAAVVEDERPVKTVAVREQPRRDDRRAAERGPDEPPLHERALRTFDRIAGRGNHVGHFRKRRLASFVYYASQN